jgi:hypothetical protein
MTQWSPIWLVEIDGVEYTDAVLANLTIRSGRTNIYEQAQAGYVNLQLLDVSQTAIPVNINSTIGVSVKDTSGAFVAIFGGNVVDIGLEVRDVGSTMFTQTYSITALGALARLPKFIFTDSLARDFDGDQIFEVLSQILFQTWAEVPGALTWATYAPAVTWANAGNTGIGEIDRPGNYDLSARGGGLDPIDAYSWFQPLRLQGWDTFMRTPRVALVMPIQPTERLIFPQMVMLTLMQIKPVPQACALKPAWVTFEMQSRSNTVQVHKMTLAQVNQIQLVNLEILHKSSPQRCTIQLTQLPRQISTYHCAPSHNQFLAKSRLT